MNPASAHRISPLTASVPVRGNVCSLTPTGAVALITGAWGAIGTTG